MKHLLSIAFCLLLLSACDDRPDGVMSKGKMERVLYDYHLAQAIGETSGRHSEKSRDYIDAVFQKHGITRAEFDSSMVYYNIHNEDLKDIYEDLKERFAAANDEIQLTTGTDEMAAIFTEGGDTTNMWYGSPVIVLRQHTLLNLDKFTIKADTSFRSNDRFLLIANAHFINETPDNSSATLTASLSIRNVEKKTFSQVRSLTSSGHIQLDISSAMGKDLTNVSGYFYYQNTSPSPVRSFCIIDGIRLIRMHAKESVETDSTTVAEDSVYLDSLPADKSRQPRQPRRTPEEMREDNKGDTHTIIRKAPDVRTPNSFGPSRRRSKPIPR